MFNVAPFFECFKHFQDTREDVELNYIQVILPRKKTDELAEIQIINQHYHLNFFLYSVK